MCLHSAEDKQLHLFSVNGEPLACTSLRLWDAARGGYSVVRALLGTPSAAPGFVVVVEDGGLAVRRAHNLTLCCAVKCRADSAIRCATIRESAANRFEIVVGLENGQVIAWVLNMRDLII